ncbi:hypothetical protein HDK77DRAFT_462505 [Phyllosticta capitalensis]
MGDRSQQVLAINIVFFAMTWIAMSLRVYTRAYLIKSWGIDDWAMMSALLLYTGYLICQDGGVVYGTGRKDSELEKDAIMKALRWWWFCELFYTLATAMLKVAVGLFLLRIAVKRNHVILIYIMNVAVLVLSFAYFFVFIFQCSPMETFWTIKPNNENCMNPDAIVGIAYAAAALGSISDWIFGVLPGFVVWDLQMNMRTKVVVVCILAFAAIGSTATLVRMPYIKGFAARHDFLYESTDIAIWSTIEPGIGMTAACIATLRPLLQHVLHRTGLSTPRATTGRSASNWSTGNALGSSKNRTGYLRSQDDGHTLGNLRPDYTATATIVTGPGTVKKGGGGGWRSNGSDEASKSRASPRPKWTSRRATRTTSRCVRA